MPHDNARTSIRSYRHTPASSLSSSDPDKAYVRSHHLPRLIALWPRELNDMSRAGSERILQRLRHALRAERRRGRAGHWSYDLNRHLGLVRAYKAELAHLERLDGESSPAAVDPSGKLAGLQKSGAA